MTRPVKEEFLSSILSSDLPDDLKDIVLRNLRDDHRDKVVGLWDSLLEWWDKQPWYIKLFGKHLFEKYVRKLKKFVIDL